MYIFSLVFEHIKQYNFVKSSTIVNENRMYLFFRSLICYYFDFSLTHYYINIYLVRPQFRRSL